MDDASYRMHWRPQVLIEWVLAVVIGCLVASSWRGAWYILDSYLWPDDKTMSSSMSLLIGALLFWLLVALQPFLGARINAFGRAARLVDLLFSYVGFWSCVLIWRGAWVLWDVAFDGPTDDSFTTSAWVSHVVGISFLVLLGAVRSLNAPPTLLVSDCSPPILGASTTPGLPQFMCQLWKAAPQMSSKAWYEAVGLPCKAAQMVDSVSSEMVDSVSSTQMAKQGPSTA